MKESPPPQTTTTLTSLLELCNHLLSPDLLPSIQTFRGKWSLLLTKLSLLHSNLLSLSESPSHPLSLHLLSSISATLSSAADLASQCLSPSPASGKLRTQSDLDSLSSLLSNHLRDSDILLRSGILSSPSSSIKNLLTELQIGSPDSKSSSMDSLLDLLHADDKNVLIAVSHGIVPILVRNLDEICSVEMKEKSVAAIARVSTVETSKHCLLAEGLLLLNHLLRVLESGSGFAMEKSCVALQALSFSKENARAIGSRGGISSLLEICQSGTPSSQGAAAGVLRNLARFEDIKENFMEENAVFVLVAMVASGTVAAKENAIGCLASLVEEDDGLKVVVVKEGLIESLKSYFEDERVREGKGMESALDLVGNLASCSQIGEVLVSEGFVPRIVELLRCGVLSVRIAAAGAVYEISYGARSRREIGECGGVGSMVRMLEGKAAEEREAAARALSRVVVCGLNQKGFRKEERGIVSVVQLLDPLTAGLDRKWPISILSTLCHSKKCRKQIVAAGACAYLQKLVELEVEGAKKLLDGLGKGRVWGVFSRP